MNSLRFLIRLVPLPLLIATAFLGAGCAHKPISRGEMPLESVPALGVTPFPDGITGETPPAWPQPATASAESITDATEQPPAAKFERASPPALGAETLTEMADARYPSRGASLSQAQEGRLAWLNHDPLDARQKLQSSLQIWGNNPYAHYYLGMLELEAGHYALATTFARNAVRNLRNNPFWNARAYLLLSETLERSGDRAGAFAARTKAFDLDPRVELR